MSTDNTLMNIFSTHDKRASAYSTPRFVSCRSSLTFFGL